MKRKDSSTVGPRHAALMKEIFPFVLALAETTTRIFRAPNRVVLKTRWWSIYCIFSQYLEKSYIP
jgi:hypothetical protein